MRVITLTRFHDIENGVTRETGDLFEVKKARGLFLIEKGVVEESTEVKSKKTKKA